MLKYSPQEKKIAEFIKMTSFKSLRRKHDALGEPGGEHFFEFED